MANIVFNKSKGRINGYVDRVVNNDPAASGLIVVLLTANEADSVLEDYDTLAALIGAAGNTEANFTNYARKVLTDTDLSAPVVDDTNDKQTATFSNLTWSSAGGTVDNTTTKAIVCYAPDVAGADSTLTPLTCSDYAATTTGFDLVLGVPTTFYEAS